MWKLGKALESVKFRHILTFATTIGVTILAGVLIIENYDLNSYLLFSTKVVGWIIGLSVFAKFVTWVIGKLLLKLFPPRIETTKNPFYD